MSKQIQLSIRQREKALIELIRDAEIMGFSLSLIQSYKNQLFEIQREIKSEEAKKEQFRFNIIERGLN